MDISNNTQLRIITNDLFPRKFGLKGKIWITFLCLLIVAGLIGYIRQIKFGLSVTGMRDYASWGIYISNFVFFVAISLVGSLITAILRLTNARWSTPLTRISEIMAVAAIIMAAVSILVDMGRPDRFLHLFLYGRLQSPIIWDVLVISTYLVLSLLLLYIPLIPDLKIMFANRTFKKPWVKKCFRILTVNWNFNKDQISISNRAIHILSITIIPVALAIHTVTAWLFATTYRPGWDSTNFGPYFVSGAFLVGAGGVVVAMYVFRKSFNLEDYITHKHFDYMGKLLVMLALLYLYFNINEYLVPGFKMKETEAEHLAMLFTGDYAVMFWSVIILGMVVPVIVLLFPAGRKPKPMLYIGILVVVGAWFKRYLIVTPTLLHPFLPIYDVPESYHTYFPTWEEWAITLSTLAAALLIITILARFLPIVPIYETAKERKAIKHEEDEKNKEPKGKYAVQL